MTVDLMREVRYDGAYTFMYSARERTKAWEMGDTVPEDVKSVRVTEIVDIQRAIALEINQGLVGTIEQVLIEGPSKKSDAELMGRTDTNKTVIVRGAGQRVGDMVACRIGRANAATLFGTPVTAGAHTGGDAA